MNVPDVGDAMVEPAALEARPLFPVRERRILLWVGVAAICWRWLEAVRSPLPSADACRDLWLAGRLGQGDVAALASAPAQPLWALLLAPAAALHVDVFQVAQVLACVFGGLLVWPVAVAGQKLREGAGVPAAILALAAAGAVGLAATGSAAPLLAFVAAAGVAAFVSGRWVLAALSASVAIAGGVDSLVGDCQVCSAPWHLAVDLRLGMGVAGALAVLSALPPRPLRIVGLWLAAGTVLALAFVFGASTRAVVIWSPIVIVLAGVGLARLPVRVRDVLLCGAVALDFYTAWHAVEPREAIVERALGRYLQRQLAPGQQVVSDLPRVLYFAGQKPIAAGDADALLHRASAVNVASIVLDAVHARQPTLTATLAGRFARYDLPHDLVDLVADRQLTVYGRR
ncbi:MAG: hypothetical protein ABIP94_05990 [Planctomycetota bacterium]